MPEANVESYSMSVMEMISHSGWMGKSVILVLVIFSIMSWAIILQKFFVYRMAKEQDGRFLSIFSKSESLTNIYNFSRSLKYSPIARVFASGYNELLRMSKVDREDAKNHPETELSISDIKGITLAMNKTINKEIDHLAHRLDFLATTGSTTPFIGLFGTVWGIMTSFRAISVKGSASIGGVAPGIAEALIATAAGLVAAIPAVIFYNYLSNKIRLFTSRMDDFSDEFIYLAEKTFLR